MEPKEVGKMGLFMALSSILFFIGGYYMWALLDGITYMIPIAIGAILLLQGGKMWIGNKISSNVTAPTKVPTNTVEEMNV